MRIYSNIREIIVSLICIAMFTLSSVFASDRVVTYPIPEGIEMNPDFTVEVSADGKNWQVAPSYPVKVAKSIAIGTTTEIASWAAFDFEGRVYVRVRYNRGDVQTSRIRPLSYGISHRVEGNILSFTLERPCNISVEVNNDIFHNLHLFANPIDKYQPKDLKNPNLVYFGPGVHRLLGDSLQVTSGQTVYVAGGAVVFGTIQVHGVKDVKVLGRGRVHPEGRGAGISICHSKNVFVDGLVTTQCPTGGSDDVTIHNVKAISSYGWGDGMNVFSSKNVLFDRVFCRNSDDCTTVYGTRFGFEGSSSNITMQNSTLWADVAHPIFIGIHGNVDKPEILENLNYVNIDILDHKEKQLNYQGCLAINAGDENLIRNVRFEDIRIENFRQGQLVNLRIFFNEKYCKAPGRGIENVVFKNVSYTGNRAEISVIEGYDAQRKVRNIRFENLRINGQIISDDMSGKPKWYHTGDMARIYVGPHVEGVSFLNTFEK